MRLPEASEVQELAAAPVIEVSRDGVTLNGRPVPDAAQPSLRRSLDKISDLHDQLVALRDNFELLHPSERFVGRVIAKIDRDIAFSVLKRVLYTANRAGYRNVELLVQSKH